MPDTFTTLKYPELPLISLGFDSKLIHERKKYNESSSLPKFEELRDVVHEYSLPSEIARVGRFGLELREMKINPTLKHPSVIWSSPIHLPNPYFKDTLHQFTPAQLKGRSGSKKVKTDILIIDLGPGNRKNDKAAVLIGCHVCPPKLLIRLHDYLLTHELLSLTALTCILYKHVRLYRPLVIPGGEPGFYMIASDPNAKTDHAIVKTLLDKVMSSDKTHVVDMLHGLPIPDPFRASVTGFNRRCIAQELASIQALSNFIKGKDFYGVTRQDLEAKRETTGKAWLNAFPSPSA